MHRFYAAPVTIIFIVKFLTTPNTTNDAVVRIIFARGLDPMVPVRSLNPHVAAFTRCRGTLRQLGRPIVRDRPACYRLYNTVLSCELETR